jgi:anti-sigma regulatory factor (Ser/Thr protein kinase)
LEPVLERALIANVRLLVSELVTNSIRHAHTPAWASIDLVATAFADRVRVEVGDHGPGFDRMPPDPGPESLSGWASTSWIS